MSCFQQYSDEESQGKIERRFITEGTVLLAEFYSGNFMCRTTVQATTPIRSTMGNIKSALKKCVLGNICTRLQMRQ